VGHRFAVQTKQPKSILDSVTYVGFVDFTTTIDDTVVIFRPKSTFSTQTRGFGQPNIQPTSAFTSTATPSFSHSPSRPHPTFGGVASSPAPTKPTGNELTDTDTSLAPAQTAPELEGSSSSVDSEDQTGAPPPLDAIDPHRVTTSGIDALKSLLSSSAASRSVIRSPNTRSRFSVAGSNSVKPSSVRPGVGAGAATAAPSIEDVATVADGLTVPVTEPSIELLPSIDPTSDVELVFKTLYTTYTYFTTFFRESTSKVKSREEVISNVVTLTNILKPTDIPAVSISCELDSSCIFHSTDILSLPPSGFTDGFIGRPNTGPAELPRNGEGVPIPDANFEDDVSINSSISPAESHEDSSSILRTFYTTYTYFSTLFVDGTSSVSTRTEVYSNIQSADGQLSQQTADTEPFLHATSSSFISNSPSQVPSVDSSLEESTSAASSVQSLSGRRLETSSLGVA